MVGLASLPPELLAEVGKRWPHGNPLNILVRHVPCLSKALHEAAQEAIQHLVELNLYSASMRVDDAAVTAVAAHCTQLQTLRLHGSGSLTDAAVTAVAAHCTQLRTLDLTGCGKITKAAMTAVADRCMKLHVKRGNLRVYPSGRHLPAL